MRFSTKTTMPTTYSFRQVAEVLNIEGIGRNTLMKILRKAGVLNSDGFPYEEYIDAGYFEFRARPVYNRNYTAATVLGKKGLDFITKVVHEYLKKENKNE